MLKRHSSFQTDRYHVAHRKKTIRALSLCVSCSLHIPPSNFINKRQSLENKRRENQLYPEAGFSKMKASVPCQWLPYRRKTELWRHLCSWLTVTDLRDYCNCPAANAVCLLLLPLSADPISHNKQRKLTEWSFIRHSWDSHTDSSTAASSVMLLSLLGTLTHKLWHTFWVQHPPPCHY